MDCNGRLYWNYIKIFRLLFADVIRLNYEGGGNMSSGFWTMPHVVLGVWGIFATLWFVVEVINVSEKNLERIKKASVVQAVLISASYLVGGWWYVAYYAAFDRGVILKGPFPQGHTFFMEAKEHIFFILLLFSLILPVIASQNNLLADKNARKLAMTVAVVIIVLGFSMEGAGSFISQSVKLGLGGK
jgi:hypothetical protein